MLPVLGNADGLKNYFFLDIVILPCTFSYYVYGFLLGKSVVCVSFVSNIIYNFMLLRLHGGHTQSEVMVLERMH